MTKKKSPQKPVFTASNKKENINDSKSITFPKQPKELMGSFLSKTGETESKVDFEYTKTLTQTKEKKKEIKKKEQI